MVMLLHIDNDHRKSRLRDQDSPNSTFCQNQWLSSVHPSPFTLGGFPWGSTTEDNKFCREKQKIVVSHLSERNIFFFMINS